MVQVKKIYILMIKLDKLFSFFIMMFSKSFEALSACARVHEQHNHFPWLEVNSCEEKSLNFESRVLESPSKVLELLP